MLFNQFFLLLLTSCALLSPPAPVSPSLADVPVIEGNRFITLQFDRGEADLDSESRKHLNELALEVGQDHREVKEIKILAWPDQEYPPEGKKAPPRDIILAQDRARVIEDYLRDELHAQNKIQSFNMAKKPGLLGEMTKNKDWKIKEAQEQTGATASVLPDGSISYTKASKVIIIIDYQ
jgi:hypothetical protein